MVATDKKSQHSVSLFMPGRDLPARAPSALSTNLLFVSPAISLPTRPSTSERRYYRPPAPYGKVAVVDSKSRVVVFDVLSKEVVFQESGASR